MLAQWRNAMEIRWQKLNLVQRWYLLSTFALVLWLLTLAEADPLFFIFAFMLVTATVIDMWQSAIKIWHSLPGKVILLVSYAILANFCFAFAESQMNAISGIKPELTPFSVNLMIALQAPIWTFILSILMSMVYLTVHTLKVMLMLMVRPVSKVHAEMMHQESYPFISLLARIIYMPVVLVFVSVALQGYLTGNTDNILHINESSITVGAVQQGPNGKVIVVDENKPAGDQVTLPENAEDDLFTGGVPSIPWANKFVANFLYQVESQGKSHCKITGPEHAVQINDYEILVITPDKTQELGYRFMVRACNSANLPKILQLPTPSN